jgi:hypothetical protein
VWNFLVALAVPVDSLCFRRPDVPLVVGWTERGGKPVQIGSAYR